MCATCGCDDSAGVRVIDPAHPQAHPHEHPHEHDHPQGHPHEHPQGHPHEHPHGEPTPAAAAPRGTITLEQRVLAKNDQLATANRRWLTDRGLASVNLMSSPGSGKTTLLVRTVGDLRAELGLSVVECDQETLLDADRLAATGCRVIQVNTGSGCHLDADMLRRALIALDPPAPGLVLIENVGNLVCPALFDLGEQARVVIASVTEGADKPLKYPNMFHAASLVILNKIDLLPYVDFDVDAFVRAVSMVSRQAPVLQVSATTGAGLAAWYDWLRGRLPAPS
ncbi:MAG: hydrogenase nickel incorporation protein HypB [Jatrophihabitans sp.]